jgi:hypothetical protein
MLKRSFKILILASLILQTVTACFAQNQNIYRNSKGHFSFILPDGWEEIPKDVINSYCKALQEQSLQPLTVKYEVGFQKISKNYFTYPYMLIQIDQGGRLPETKRQEFKKYTQEGMQEIETSLSHLIQNVELGQTIYDEKRHILFAKMKTEVTGIGEILSVSALILSNYGAVNIHFYSTEDRFIRNLEYFNQVIGSFSFDQGYEYSESKTRKSYSSGMGGAIEKGVIGLILGGFFALLFGLKKLFQGKNKKDKNKDHIT